MSNSFVHPPAKSSRRRSCSRQPHEHPSTPSHRYDDWGADRRDELGQLAEELEAELASTSHGYVNFLDHNAARSCYSQDTYTRLVSLKNEYDPTNVFRLHRPGAST